MNTIDFTQPGGFPLTQDILSFLQSSYVDGLTGLASVIDDGNTPVIISGMTISHPSGGTAVSDGWLYYRGQLIKFNASSLGVLSGGIVPLVLVTNTSSTLTFNNGTTPNVLFTQNAHLISGTPLTDTTHFVLSDAVPFIIQMGRLGREPSFASITSTTSAASGGVFWLMKYKKISLAILSIFASPGALPIRKILLVLLYIRLSILAPYQVGIDLYLDFRSDFGWNHRPLRELLKIQA